LSVSIKEYDDDDDDDVIDWACILHSLENVRCDVFWVVA